MRKKTSMDKWCGGIVLPIFAVLLLLCCRNVRILAADEESGEPIRIRIVHNNPCESCNEEARLTELVKSLEPEGGADYELEIYYAYRKDGQTVLEKLLEQFDLEENRIFYPFLVIGDRYLSGEQQIEEHLTEYMSQADTEETENSSAEAKESERILDDSTKPEEPENRLAESEKPEESESMGETTSADEAILYLGEETIHLVYFHTANCSSCETAEEYLASIPDTMAIDGKDYPIVITRLSLADPKNAELFQQLAEKVPVKESDRKVPLLILGENYLSGEDQICSGTEELLKKGAGLGADYRMENGETEAKPEYQNHPVRAVVEDAGAGFLNGFNPCALSMVLLFFSLIAALKKGFLRNGLLFLFGKLAAYILLGMLIANAFSLVPFTLFGVMKKVINLVLILLCLVLAAGNFFDAYHAYKGEYGKIRVQLPVGLRRWNHKLIRGFTGLEESPAFPIIIILGSMVISLGEFLCTGQIYLASILRWVQVDGGYIPVVLFVVYASAMCLPALLILLLIHKGKSVLSFTDLSLQKMPVIKLLNGLLFLLFFLWAVCNF